MLNDLCQNYFANSLIKESVENTSCNNILFHYLNSQSQRTMQWFDQREDYLKSFKRKLQFELTIVYYYGHRKRHCTELDMSQMTLPISHLIAMLLKYSTVQI